jgi:hypothetical protein
MPVAIPHNRCRCFTSFRPKIRFFPTGLQPVVFVGWDFCAAGTSKKRKAFIVSWTPVYRSKWAAWSGAALSADSHIPFNAWVFHWFHAIVLTNFLYKIKDIIIYRARQGRWSESSAAMRIRPLMAISGRERNGSSWVKTHESRHYRVTTQFICFELTNFLPSK